MGRLQAHFHCYQLQTSDQRSGVTIQAGILVHMVPGCGQARMERMRQRAATAKAVRNAQTLARFWQTQGRLTWQDAAACSLFVASLAGLSQLWQ